MGASSKVRHLVLFLVVACLGAAWAQLPAHADGPSGRVAPSFDCAVPGSPARALICQSADLGALDRDLNDTYGAVMAQGTIAGTPLADQIASQETRWRLQVRDHCRDERCLRAAYLDRIAALDDVSLKAANPAVYAQTRPFDAPQPDRAAAARMMGGQCGDPLIAPPPGAAALPPAWRPIIQIPGMAIVPVRIGTTAFALLEDQPAMDRCSIRDIVVLPRLVPASFHQPVTYVCQFGDDSGSLGLGVGPSPHRLRAFWIADARLRRLRRVAISQDGKNIQCRQAESGE